MVRTPAPFLKGLERQARKTWRASAVAVIVSIAFGGHAANQSTGIPAVARPTQFVLLAFDGSKSLDFWSKSIGAAEKQGAKYTYFASGVYFLSDAKKMAYTHPVFGPGKSAIGFGGKNSDILSRIGFMNRASDSGHEIASHGNGHFPGASKWRLDQWGSELDQLPTILNNVFKLNGILSGWNRESTAEKPFVFNPDHLEGFRAPFLEYNLDMYQALGQRSFRYDTSQVSKTMAYWPERRKNGIWNFPLAPLAIAGTAKHTISMDYNFYFADSKGVPNPALSATYEKQEYETLMNYFRNNYNGNRAPVHVGHHFESWNGNAYMNAFNRFAETVCKMPDVKCITYRELADFMDGLSPETLAAYRLGKFKEGTTPGPIVVPALIARPILVTPANEAAPIRAELRADRMLSNSGAIAFRIVGSDSEALSRNARFTASLNGRGVTFKGNVADLSGSEASDGVLEVTAEKEGVEILRQSFHVQADDQNGDSVNVQPVPDRAMFGDLPEAHIED